MKALLSTLLLLPLLFATGQAQCPAPTELQNPHPNGTKVCAQMYTDNSPYYDLCCAGSLLMVLEGEDQPYMPTAFNNKVSSLVVAQRCELTVWYRKGKAGSTRVFKAGAYPRLQEFKRAIFSNWDNAISAYYCKCR
ncbi:syncollin [Pseudonaja textilis]|uniref:Syncollin n=1 Tax=Pseudonaja textilis TaxID=8673 RepID=A0A670Z3I7_PSETE|nr:syncollin [Pseudonaja textilis]